MSAGDQIILDLEYVPTQRCYADVLEGSGSLLYLAATPHRSPAGSAAMTAVPTAASLLVVPWRS